MNRSGRLGIAGFVVLFGVTISGGVKAADTPATSPSAAIVTNGANSFAWGDWPADKDPREVGKRIVQNFLDRDKKGDKSVDSKVSNIGYPEACTAYGTMRFDNSIHDKDQLDALIAKYQNVVSDAGTLGSRLNKPSGVDANLCGIVPLELYSVTGKTAFLDTGRNYADAQFDKDVAQKHFKVKPDDYLQKNGGTHPPDGLSWETRYWVDDMFMIIGLQMEAYRTTKDPIYANRATAEMVSYLDKLQQPNGLFYHEITAPFFWGRGDGWFAVGMAEVLSSLPADHPQHARILDGYKKMMAALKKYQAPNGAWSQLIDDPTVWSESSCTAMFTFGMAEGVRHGWLDDSYKQPAKNGWIAVTNFLDKDANMTQVCIGTNRNTSRQYYLDRPRETGNLHGQAAAIWAAWALLDQQ